jgi:hypothetical protein
MDATKVNTPDTRESWVARNCSNTRLVSNERKGPLDLVSDRSGSCNSIQLPPIRGFVDFRGCAASDADRQQLTQARLRRRERRVSPETTSPRRVSSIA